MITLDPPGAAGGEWEGMTGWAAEDRRWRAERAAAVAGVAGVCTTCRRVIRAGEAHYRDRWRAPVLGRRVASVICSRCAAAGL